MRAVAHDPPPPVLVALVQVWGDVILDLSLQCLGQHPAGTLADQLVDQGRAIVPARVIGIGGSRNYGELSVTGRTFPTGVGAPILLEGLQVIGRVRPLSLIHGSQALLPQGLGGFSPRDPRHAGAASASHCRGALRGRRRVQAVDASNDQRWRRGDHQMHRAGRPGCESPLRPARKPLGVTATAPR